MPCCVGVTELLLSVSLVLFSELTDCDDWFSELTDCDDWFSSD